MSWALALALSAQANAEGWTQVTPVYTVPPEMPVEAQREGIEGDCRVRLFLDEAGVPYDVVIEDCPEVFQQAVLDVAWDYRFEPMRVDGQPVKSSFVYVFQFKHPAAGEPTLDVFFHGSGRLAHGVAVVPPDGWGGGVRYLLTFDALSFTVASEYERMGWVRGVEDLQRVDLLFGVGYAPLRGEFGRVGVDLQGGLSGGYHQVAGYQVVSAGGTVSVGLPLTLTTSKGHGLGLRPHYMASRYALNGDIQLPLQAGVELGLIWRWKP